MKILLIEDDIQLNTTVRTFLEIKKYEVESSFDGEEALLLIDKNRYDAYVIDINLPKINGLEIVKYIRQKDKETPIIIITASLEVDNFLKAYEYGCSEYIKKPFHLKELELRMDNLFESKKSKILKLTDAISFDVNFDELFINEESVKLRKKEKRLLSILIKNLDHIVKNEDIANYVWENEIKENYPLRQLVAELRKKFNLEKNYIISQIGVGYKFET